jgi:hypothetical protein
VQDRYLQRTRIFQVGRHPSLRAAKVGGLNAEQIIVEAVGWAGAFLILLAYFLLSSGKLTGQSVSYQWMNVVGAAGFVVNGWWHRALPSATLNVLWLMIGVFAIIRITQRRRRAQ